MTFLLKCSNRMYANIRRVGFSVARIGSGNKSNIAPRVRSTTLGVQDTSESDKQDETTYDILHARRVS